MLGWYLLCIVEFVLFFIVIGRLVPPPLSLSKYIGNVLNLSSHTYDISLGLSYDFILFGNVVDQTLQFFQF